MNSFRKSLLTIAVPVTLQSLLQSSFSVIDEIMIGQLGSESIAGIGLGGKFSSIYSVVLGAVVAAAGIMIAQYIGQKNMEEVSKSFHTNLGLAIILAVIFTVASYGFAENIMPIYTKDESTRILSVEYLKIYSIAFLPMAVSTMMTVILRCIEKAVFPLVASIISVLLNTGLNYLLIFGKFGFPNMGVEGAAFASVVSQIVSCAATIIFFVIQLKKYQIKIIVSRKITGQDIRLYVGILGPILICEFLWTLGENVYSGIYGNIGTKALAAMTMTGPIQVLIIGVLSGLSQAAGIMVGKSLGNSNFDRAYIDAKKLMKYGVFGSLALSAVLILLGRYYVSIYNVEQSVMDISYGLLVVFAIVSPVKVQNMILGGGIIRSGGKTKYVMWIDIIGTWIFGVPLGLLSAFVLKLPVTYVYFILSMEECVRFFISLIIFKKKSWMNNI